MASEREALLAVHETERRAHLEGDAGLLASLFCDTVWEAGRGQLRVMSRADVERQFSDYFATVRYVRWDDLQPPHVWVSEDGRYGWMAIHIEGRLSFVRDGSQMEESFESAWIAVYEKHDAEWRMAGISSSVVERETA